MLYVIIQAVYSKYHVKYIQAGSEAHQPPTNYYQQKGSISWSWSLTTCLVSRLRKHGAILPRPFSHTRRLSKCKNKSSIFQTRSILAHKWRSQRSRYVLPAFSDRSQHFGLGRSLSSVVTVQCATVCTELVSCVSIDGRLCETVGFLSALFGIKYTPICVT